MRYNKPTVILIVINLENLKSKTWVLVVFSRILLFLVSLATDYLK